MRHEGKSATCFMSQCLEDSTAAKQQVNITQNIEKEEKNTRTSQSSVQNTTSHTVYRKYHVTTYPIHKLKIIEYHKCLGEKNK